MVEVLPTKCFAGLQRLNSLTFEPESKLREIRHGILCDCFSITSILLPASVSIVEGSFIVGSTVNDIRVEKKNPHFVVSGHLLVTTDKRKVVRLIGLVKGITVEARYESLGNFSFIGCHELTTIVFEKGSRLGQIGDWVFGDCCALKSICIPASVEEIGEMCFLECRALAQFSFESGSKCSKIGVSAFELCSSLTSFCAPAGVVCIPQGCFLSCNSLVRLSFDQNAKLTKIDHQALESCDSLVAMVLPGALEVTEADVFAKCFKFSRLEFEMPSRIR
jgi:hypothetical protein